MAADANVVANLDLIVDLGAFADHRVIHGAAIDRGVRADLDIVLDDDTANLDDLQHAAWTGGITETVLPDARTIVDNHIITDERGKNACAAGNGAIASDLYILPDDDTGPDPRTSTDMGAGADHCERLDNDARFQLRGRIDMRSMRNFAFHPRDRTGTHRRGVQQGTNLGKQRVWIFRYQRGDVGRKHVHKGSVTNDGGGFAGLQLIAVLARKDIAELIGFCPIDRRNGPDNPLSRRLIRQFRPKAVCDVFQSQSLVGRKKRVVFH